VNPAALRPSEASALIIGVSLPAGLEALRQRHVADAANGLPAHVTLAYPFAWPESIDDAVGGGAIDVFVPHVTIAEGPGADDPALDDDPGWDDLPVTLAVSAVELIVLTAAGRWGVAGRFPMRG